MLLINENTKKAKGFINTYRYYEYDTNGDSLHEIYNNFSYAKERALNYCKSLRAELNGFGACFGGHNCFTFTYMFLFKENGVTYLAYITANNNYKTKYE